MGLKIVILSSLSSKHKAEGKRKKKTDVPAIHFTELMRRTTIKQEQRIEVPVYQGGGPVNTGDERLRKREEGGKKYLSSPGEGGAN